jgi:carboxypeptidase C (cathepsin A)
MMLTSQLQQNVHFTYYPAGHMVYLNVQALAKLRDDLRGFYATAEK